MSTDDDPLIDMEYSIDGETWHPCQVHPRSKAANGETDPEQGDWYYRRPQHKEQTNDD